MYEAIPLSAATIGDYLLTPEGTVWEIDCDEAVSNIPQVAFYYDSLGMGHLFLAFKTFEQAQFYFRRN